MSSCAPHPARHTALALALLCGGAATAGERPCLPSSDLPAAAYRLGVDPHAAYPCASALLMVRAPDGRLRVWFLPLKQGLPTMPTDAHWRAGPPCERLTVDFSIGRIACGASSFPAELMARYRWTLEGQPLDPQVPALIPVPGSERAGRFLIQGGSASDICSP